MTRAIARLLAVTVIAILALGAGTGATQAADGDFSLVPKSRLKAVPELRAL